MSGCINKQFEEKLFAYEIGILSEGERRELELHILDCDSCREEIKKFDEAALLIRHDEATRGTIAEIAESELIEKKESSPPTNIWRTLIPIAAAAVVVLMLVLQPWHIEIHPGQDAIASENRLAILWFENLADQSDSLSLEKIVSNLLITDLAESHHIQVVSGQRISDIINQLGGDESGQIDNQLAVEIAQKAGASWLMTGTVLQLEPSIILTSQIIDVVSGNIISSQRVNGDVDSTIFSVIDKLSSAVRADLPIPDGAMLEPDRKISEFTTNSTKAYRYYLDGLNYYGKYFYPNARRSFEQVLEIDSTFAMAYYYLAIIKSAKLLDKAIEYMDNASEKDKYYIRYLEATRARNIELRESILDTLLMRYPDEKNALYLLGTSKYYQKKYEEAIVCFEQALKLDPSYKQIHNMLAFAYNRQGKFDQALEANEKYISIAPDEPNPYDSRGALFAQNGMLDSSLVAYKKALEIKPDFSSSLEGSGVMHLLNEEYEKAAVYFHKLASSESKSLRSQGRYYLALIPLYQGKIKQALEVINDCMAADRLEGAELEQGYKHVIRAIIYEGINQTDSAFAEIEKSLEYDQGYYHPYYSMMARNGEIQRAQQELEHLKDSLDATPAFLFQYYLATGAVDFVAGDFEQAINSLTKAEEISPVLPVMYLLGRSYLQAGYFDKAIELFRKQLTNYNSYLVCRGTWSVKMFYYLGLAYEGAGRFEEARVQYQRFLDIWKDADEGIVEIEDARTRLAGLQKQS